jgi:exodeoxyribonuclease VII large subunit
VSLFDLAAADEPRRVRLFQLSREITERLNPIGRVEVEGEVHSFRRFPSGAAFTLRDRTARVPVWWSASGGGECRVREGSRARVVGRLRWDNVRAVLQLSAEQAVPTGAGEVAELIAAARERLRAAGMLDRDRRPVPVLPAAVGVVCGREAAVRRDIESVVATRWPGYPLRFAEVAVTGAGAAQAIADALRDLADRPEVEVVILARGGGDAADLLPWSNEDLCRALADCPVPVVSAIGHEEDRPLCDEVADLRCGTPSLAAGAVIPDPNALAALVDGLLGQAGDVCLRRVQRSRIALNALAPGRALDQRAVAARHRITRLRDSVTHLHPVHRVGQARRALAALEREREALSPARVLERGYAVVRPVGGGAALRDAGEVKPGESVEVQLASGSFEADVTRTTERMETTDGEG